MPFNGDSYHIMNADSSKFLDDVMVFFEQFRLPLLFLISGTGTMFACRKRSWLQFIKERSYRLLIPLIFGILVIVPPQSYYEFIDQYQSYCEVYQGFNWSANHLWFIENLFIMSLVLIPLILFLKTEASEKLITYLDRIALRRMGIFLWVLPLLIPFVILKNIDPSDSKDITNVSVTFYYTYFFVSGMLFTRSQRIWYYLKKHRSVNCKLFVCSAIIFYGYYYIPNDFIAPYLSTQMRWNLWYTVCCLVSWTLVTTLLGYGQIWFTKSSVLLSKSNEAIYPFYILHQTIIVVIGYYLIQYDLPIGVKILLLLVTTFPIIVLVYRFLVYPFTVTRVLFGMKKKIKKV